MTERCWDDMDERLIMNRLQTAMRIGIPDLGDAQNNLGAERVVREMRRGGLLDKHMGETGYSTVIGPGSDPRPLLQLSSINRTNPLRVTVGIDVEEVAPPAVPALANHRVMIELRWATGKGRSTAFVDARHGSQIGLTANVLNVGVRYLGQEGPTVRVGASAGYGSRHGGVAAQTFSEAPFAPLAQGALSGFVRIPKYASRVQWVSSNDPLAIPAPAVTLNFWPSNVIGLLPVSLVSVPASTFVPIPNGADFILIRNDGPAAGVYRLIYEIIL